MGFLNMLLTFKTLQGQTFTLEVDPTITVSDVKAKIETEKGSDTFPSGKQKLIYNGKVLENADPLSKYEINEKKFLVVMVPKPQAPAKPVAETPAPAPPATPAGASAAPSTGVAASDLVVGEDYNLMVQNIMDMGYGKDEV